AGVGIAGDEDEGRMSPAGGDERGRRVGQARTAGGGGDTDVPSSDRVPEGRQHGRVLVTHVDGPYAVLLDERPDKVHVRVTHQPEDDRHAVPRHTLGDDLITLFHLVLPFMSFRAGSSRGPVRTPWPPRYRRRPRRRRRGRSRA